ncbi:PQQ-binding-like beta-propeller repeat protein [Halobacterium yunchengense]|uniref:outer membrane protein assembly factor BamB family protein n=1 Tax=Halobacterium yunchengense TaxID=3108497 RepID=UPI00300B3317
MEQRRLSRRALLAGLGSAVAATAGCAAPADSERTTAAPSGAATTREESTGDPATETTSQPDISLSGEAAWATYGYDPGHSGYNPDAAGPADDPSVVWNSDVSGIYTLREPAVADGRVFVGSNRYTWAFDAESGEQRWRRDLGGMTHHFAPTHHDDTLYAVAKEASGVNSGAPGSVRALDPADGGQRWSTAVPATSTVALGDDRLYVAGQTEADTGFVQVLAPDSGERGWRFDVPDAPGSYVTGAPTAVDGTVYVAATRVASDGSTAGTLYALDTETGDVDWTFDTDGSLPVAPVVADGRVHLASRDGTVYALTPDGGTAWTRTVEHRIYTRPTYGDGRLFVLTAADIVAFDADGEQEWRAANDRTQMSGMALADGTLYVGGEPLFALDAASGDVVFDLPVGVYHGAYGAPVVVDDVMYAGVCIKEEPGAPYDNSVRAYV